jgi:hypothetical protein
MEKRNFNQIRRCDNKNTSIEPVPSNKEVVIRILTLFLYQLHSCSFFTTGLSWRLPDEFRILNFDGKQLDFVLKKIGRIVSIIIKQRGCNQSTTTRTSSSLI